VEETLSVAVPHLSIGLFFVGQVVSSDMFKFMAAACPAMCGWCGNKVNIIKGDILRNNKFLKGQFLKGYYINNFLLDVQGPLNSSFC
jgi:hypothetical protein